MNTQQDMCIDNQECCENCHEKTSRSEWIDYIGNNILYCDECYERHKENIEKKCEICEYRQSCPNKDKCTICIEEEEKPPIVIKLNRNIYYQDRDLGGLFCGANVKVDTELFTESEPFQNPKSKSYNKIKRLTLRIKDATIDFV
jgi:hypothetical protein